MLNEETKKNLISFTIGYAVLSVILLFYLYVSLRNNNLDILVTDTTLSAGEYKQIILPLVSSCMLAFFAWNIFSYIVGTMIVTIVEWAKKIIKKESRD